MTPQQIDQAIALMQRRASGYDRAVLAFLRQRTEAEERAVERARQNARKADRSAKLRERIGA